MAAVFIISAGEFEGGPPAAGEFGGGPPALITLFPYVVQP